MLYTQNNFFNYLFEHTKDLQKNFLLNPGQEISFKDLYARCEKLAEYLNDTIGVGQNIIILCPNNLFFITAYLATIKSGNVIVPLAYEIEQRNLDYIMELCEAKLVFTTNQYKNKLDFKNIQIIDESALTNILDTITNVPRWRGLGVETDEGAGSLSLASIIFTSGSTGEPKGVMISHKNLIANTSSIVDYLKLNQDDIMLVVLPFYYCYGLSLLHTHLRAGGSIVLNNMFIMLGGVINDLKKYRCTGFAGVPTHFQVLLRKSDSFKSTKFPDLKYVTQAGGKLHNAFISEFLETFPDIRFNVMYGQTEATARLTWLPPEMLPMKIGSCGKAIPGVTIKIVNDHGDEIIKGETGEIIAFGDNIMQGYYRDPESTNATLKNGWLHTGDLALLDDDGFIYLTARKKEIIKVGGRRISPKEIEEVINSMSEVVDCTIEGVYDEILGETMKAIVIVKEAASISADIIKAWCANRLSSFKIPQIIEIKDKIILTSTGKKIKK